MTSGSAVQNKQCHTHTTVISFTEPVSAADCFHLHCPAGGRDRTGCTVFMDAGLTWLDSETPHWLLFSCFFFSFSFSFSFSFFCLCFFLFLNLDLLSTDCIWTYVHKNNPSRIDRPGFDRTENGQIRVGYLEITGDDQPSKAPRPLTCTEMLSSWMVNPKLVTSRVQVCVSKGKFITSIAHDVTKIPGGFHVTSPSMRIRIGMVCSLMAVRSLTLGKEKSLTAPTGHLE